MDDRAKRKQYLGQEQKLQAGAEQCQAQHQLWKMLLEELDSDQLRCLSIQKY